MLFDNKIIAARKNQTAGSGTGDNTLNPDRRIYCIPADQGYGASMSYREKTLRIAYRLVEITVSLTALIASLPVMLVIGLIIKYDSPGPALFFQSRCARSQVKKGKHIPEGGAYSIADPGYSPEKEYWVPRTFTFIKFRTMYADARQRFPDLYNYNYSEEEIATIPFKSEDDPRVTKVGNWLRKSTLDELPNFWNVLTGDMRLVGPRPEIPEMLPNYRPDQMSKFTVKPGITGLPQISGRGRLSFQRTVAFDLEYVGKKSVFLDIKIFIMTVWKVIAKHGAF
jgi:lipopolysaccharide/colanic/teichoic acid biosynthesis glycosyltransferase